MGGRLNRARMQSALQDYKSKHGATRCMELRSAVCRSQERLGSLASHAGHLTSSATSFDALANGTPSLPSDANSTSTHSTARQTPAPSKQCFLSPRPVVVARVVHPRAGFVASSSTICQWR